MSWKPEVDTGDGIWVGNALRFATKEECDGYLSDLFSRWTTVRSIRAREDTLPVTYRWDGKLRYIKDDPEERRDYPDPDGRDFDNLGESPDY